MRRKQLTLNRAQREAENIISCVIWPLSAVCSQLSALLWTVASLATLLYLYDTTSNNLKWRQQSSCHPFKHLNGRSVPCMSVSRFWIKRDFAVFIFLDTFQKNSPNFCSQKNIFSLLFLNVLRFFKACLNFFLSTFLHLTFHDIWHFMSFEISCDLRFHVIWGFMSISFLSF